MGFKQACLSSCTCIPEANGVVSGTGGEQAAIGRPRHAKDPIGMSRKSVERLSGGRVPETDGVVIGAGGEQVAIGRPRHAMNQIRMLRKSVEQRETGWRLLLFSF